MGVNWFDITVHIITKGGEGLGATGLYYSTYKEGLIL